ncbi:hypothetical protein PVAND_005407 [Polypedilum vanderplanki]|uniref:Apolipoprotein D n=1 Tax=Polypedilum vanderplanki TaxID=319348 RepID=A0A9J6C0C5_POLVA|nr:hypothetical protein PVAND_005407 [Polypedilum vanderplanki]
MKIILLVFLFPIVISIQNDSPSIKGCPKLKLMQNEISLNQITGKWFEISKYSSSFNTGNCIFINLTLSANQTALFSYSQRFINDSRKSSLISKLNATILKTNFWSCTFNSISVKLEGFIFILDTDYNNYAVVLGCGSIGKKSVQISTTYGHSVWILSRTSSLADSFIARINDTLKQNNLSLALRKTSQTNCDFITTTTDSIK